MSKEAPKILVFKVFYERFLVVMTRLCISFMNEKLKNTIFSRFLKLHESKILKHVSMTPAKNARDLTDVMLHNA